MRQVFRFFSVEQVGGRLKKAACAAVIAMIFGFVTVPMASAVAVLSFEGLQNLESIGNFYNGGLGGFGSGPGPNYGITFSANSITVLESHPLANFTNEPSPSTVAFFLNGTADTMNVPAGFDTGFSFWYSNTTSDGSVTVFDGLNGTGNILATLQLPGLGACAGADAFCTWEPVGVGFAGIAKSVDFAGSANLIGFDNITLGAVSPVPIPASAVLFAMGLAGMAWLAWRQHASMA